MTKRLYDPKISAERIRARRKELGMLQKDLAQKSGICLSAIKKYELGIRIPEGDYRKWLADALDVYEEWIIGGNIKNDEDVLNKFASSVGKKFAKDTELFRLFMSLATCLDYEIDINEMTIKHGRKTRHISPENLSYLYWSAIKAVKAELDNKENYDKELAPLPESYIQIDIDTPAAGDIRYDIFSKSMRDKSKGGDTDGSL